jgi:hypothetical protein
MFSESVVEVEGVNIPNPAKMEATVVVEEETQRRIFNVKSCAISFVERILKNKKQQVP